MRLKRIKASGEAIIDDIIQCIVCITIFNMHK